METKHQPGTSFILFSHSEKSAQIITLELGLRLEDHLSRQPLARFNYGPLKMGPEMGREQVG